MIQLTQSEYDVLCEKATRHAEVTQALLELSDAREQNPKDFRRMPRYIQNIINKLIGASGENHPRT